MWSYDDVVLSAQPFMFFIIFEQLVYNESWISYKNENTNVLSFFVQQYIYMLQFSQTIGLSEKVDIYLLLTIFMAIIK